MAVVFSTHPLHPDAAACLAGKAALRVASDPSAATLLCEAVDASVVIARANLPPELFASAAGLRAAIRHGAGLDMIPLPAATEAGVLVANLPGVNARSVAEYVVFAILALARGFRRIDRDLRGRGWLAGRAHAGAAAEIGGWTSGIVGPGHVGRAVGAMLEGGFGMRVLLHGSGAAPASDPTRRGLDDLLAESDVVILCCPLTEATRGLIGAAQFARMKPGALLVNVARGPVVEETALLAALREGRLGGAALDVFATQPLPEAHELFGFENVILTPHLAGITAASMRRMGLGAVAEALRVLDGKLPRTLVNPEALARYRQRFGDA